MKPVEVLLVEDNAGDAILVRQIMVESRLPVKLHIARDGEQALMMLDDHNFAFDLIILDLNLPKISGTSLLRRYQRRDIPIVVFSSTWNEAEIQEALSLGAQQYVQKPTDIQAFTDAVCGMILKWTPGEQGKANQAGF